MKWLNPKPEPKIGDTRERFPFAWLPYTGWTVQDVVGTILVEGSLYP